eukprot:3329794-Rhodomonas_salina.1
MQDVSVLSALRNRVSDEDTPSGASAHDIKGGWEEDSDDSDVQNAAQPPTARAAGPTASRP